MFLCDDTYKNDMEEYNARIVMRLGVSSPIARRELMVLGESGNTVACTLYGDLVFYRMTGVKHWAAEAFELYLRAAGITVTEVGWESSGKAYPRAFWMLGYYLVNYRSYSILEDCEEIEAIEKLSRCDRLKYALEFSCLSYRLLAIPAACNLAGRILREIAADQSLFDELADFACEQLDGLDIGGVKTNKTASREDMETYSKCCFIEAAEGGYVYAGNNLAAEEAAYLTGIPEDDTEERKASAERYIGYLKLSADRFEPYAANRLGLFYLNGEVKADGRKVKLKEYIDRKAAKEYFEKATKYPDVNSAWAYYNLIRYFPTDYTGNLELLSEHMECIRELDISVYDLAMEI